MSAEVPYRVLIEHRRYGYVTVSAVTSTEARWKAQTLVDQGENVEWDNNDEDMEALKAEMVET